MRHRFGYGLAVAVLLSASFHAFPLESARQESSLEKALRLSESSRRKDQEEALSIFETLGKLKTVQGETAMLRHAELCLVLCGDERIKQATQTLSLLEGKGSTSVREYVPIALARLASAKGNRGDAVSMLDRYLAQEHETGPAVSAAYWLGCIYCSSSDQLADWRRARASLNHALQIIRSAGEHYYGPIPERLILGKLAEVDRRIHEFEVGEPMSTFERAERTQSAGRFKEAKDLYLWVEEKFPQHRLSAHAGYRIAQCVLLGGDTASARQLLKGFIARSPNGSYRGHAHILLGDILLEHDFKAKLASHEFAAVLYPEGYDPKTGETNSLEGSAISASLPDDTWTEVRADAHLRYGLCRYMERDFRTAKLHFEEELRLRPTQRLGATEVPSNVESLVICCAEERFPINFYEQVMQGDDRVQTVLFLASMYAEAGQYVKALELFQRILRGEINRVIFPAQKGYARYKEAAVLRVLFREKEAAASFKAFLDNDYRDLPMAPKALLELASMLFSMNAYAEGEDILQTVAKRYPKDPLSAKALYSYGYSRYFARDWNAAERAFSELVLRFPTSSEAKQVNEASLPYVQGMARQVSANK